MKKILNLKEEQSNQVGARIQISGSEILDQALYRRLMFPKIRFTNLGLEVLINLEKYRMSYPV